MNLYEYYKKIDSIYSDVNESISCEVALGVAFDPQKKEKLNLANVFSGSH